RADVFALSTGPQIVRLRNLGVSIRGIADMLIVLRRDHGSLLGPGRRVVCQGVSNPSRKGRRFRPEKGIFSFTDLSIAE
ncbi:hypothetical protein, partial [uncultured Boseongicola sp.]|uniref:hypothetical protein n=1 Tax=uncultured Boseongicola sp. TaxID=1648499 RepID=UPI00260E9853